MNKKIKQLIWIFALTAIIGFICGTLSNSVVESISYYYDNVDKE